MKSRWKKKRRGRIWRKQKAFMTKRYENPGLAGIDGIGTRTTRSAACGCCYIVDCKAPWKRQGCVTAPVPNCRYYYNYYY